MKSDFEPLFQGKTKAVTRIVALMLAFYGSVYTATGFAGGDPAMNEQELARNNVWHEAKLRGVAFRAIGQEPGWLLEITNGEEILVVTDYGKKKMAYPYVEPREDKAARRTEFRIDADTSLLIEGKPCSDTMSGEKFQTSVTVTIGGQTLKGCGRALF